VIDQAVLQLGALLIKVSLARCAAVIRSSPGSVAVSMGDLRGCGRTRRPHPGHHAGIGRGDAAPGIRWQRRPQGRDFRRGVGGLVRGAGAKLAIGDFLPGSSQQRSEAIGQGQRRPCGDPRIAPVGTRVPGRSRNEIDGDPAHVPAPSVGLDDAQPVRAAAGYLRGDLKLLAIKGMAAVSDRDLGDQPFDGGGSLR